MTDQTKLAKLEQMASDLTTADYIDANQVAMALRWAADEIDRLTRANEQIARTKGQIIAAQAAQIERLKTAIGTALEHAKGKGWSPDVVSLLEREIRR